MIGYVGAGSSDAAREVVAAFHRGLSEAGYVEGRNVAVEYRRADDRLDRLPPIANDLVHRPVAVIIALQSTAAALAAKASTRSIPIVFEIGTDPVEAGLVASLNQPGGNVTGIFNLIAAVAAKRLELLHDAAPSAPLLAYLVNPANAVFAEAETREMHAAARFLGLRLLILNASDRSEIEAAFTTLVREGAGGLVIGGDLLFTNNASQLIALAARNAIPTSYGRRDFAMDGGLMSYGTDFADMYRQVGIYAGRILKGEKPADLPVQLVTKMQLAIKPENCQRPQYYVPAQPARACRRGDRTRRREFIVGLGGAVAWSLAARAQQPECVARIGVLMPYDAQDPKPKEWLAAFRQGLRELGWAEGRNLRIDIRWTADSLERMRRSAKELVHF